MQPAIYSTRGKREEEMEIDRGTERGKYRFEMQNVLAVQHLKSSMHCRDTQTRFQTPGNNCPACKGYKNATNKNKTKNHCQNVYMTYRNVK